MTSSTDPIQGSSSPHHMVDFFLEQPPKMIIEEDLNPAHANQRSRVIKVKQSSPNPNSVGLAATSSAQSTSPSAAERRVIFSKSQWDQLGSSDKKCDYLKTLLAKK